MTNYTFGWAQEIEHSTEYKDSDGNVLCIEEGPGQDIVPESEEVQDYLNEWGYDGPNDWHLA